MMKKSKVILTITLFCAATSPVVAQTDFSNNEDSMFAPVNNRNVRTDSLGSDKEIPKGLKVWTIDERFGDRQEAQVDTLQHMYMNTPFTSGLRGEYNSLGNLGSPRINRIFIDRRLDQGQFIFAQPFDQHLLAHHQRNAQQLRKPYQRRGRLQGDVCRQRGKTTGHGIQIRL